MSASTDGQFARRLDRSCGRQQALPSNSHQHEFRMASMIANVAFVWTTL
jgi:hypothetical protein